MSKYKSIKTKVDGILFDSKKEASRYTELKMLERTGNISGLELQPKFAIVPAVKWNGKTLRSRFYKADFKYLDLKSGMEIVEDVKGMRTRLYSLKRQLFLSQYPQYRFIET